MIVLSAGHHPNALGATFEGNSEFPETALWASQIAKSIEDIYRAQVEVAPLTTLGNKVRWIKERHREIGVQLAVEIHFNSAPGAKPGTVSGCETLIYPGSTTGRWYAERINPAMAEFTKDRGIKDGWYKMDRPGVVDFYGDEDGDEMPDYFLRKTPCPALILEPEFIQNWDWIQKNRVKVCEALAEAIYEAVEEHNSPHP
jgi:N-acetylmuramoyl-L-alanine amidase